MSISSELLTLQNTKTAIRTAINNKGGSVEASAPFASYATAIDNLPSGSNAGFVDLVERDATTLTIPNGTTSIGKSAFRDYDGLTSVTIPSGVTKIGDNAFDGCSGLTSITIPSGVTTIGENVFNDCTSLATITVPDSVTEIGANTFEDTQWYAAQDTGGGVYNIIAGKVFYKLVEETGHTIISFGLRDCHSIADSAFASLQPGTTIRFADNTNITTIGKNAFRNFANLNSISWLKAVTKIRYNAFDGTGWYNNQADGVVWVRNVLYKYKGTMPSDTTVTITMSSIDYITDYAFQGCTGLSQLIMRNAATPPAMGDGVFDSTNDTFKIYVPAESVDTYKAASGWSNYASRIYPITQVAKVDGRLVYNYDLGMTSSTTMITSTNMQNMPAGTNLELAEGIVDAGGSFGNYTRITLPSTFTSFDDHDMIGSTTTTLVCKATTPPTAERDRIGGSNLTAIYVPAESVSAYQASNTWSSFSSIIQAIHTALTPVSPTISLSDAYEVDVDLVLDIPFNIWYMDGTEATDTYYNQRGQQFTWSPYIPVVIVGEGENEELFVEMYYDTDHWVATIYLTDEQGNEYDWVQPGTVLTIHFDEETGGNPLDLPTRFKNVDGTWVVEETAENREGSFTVTLTA